MGVVVSSSVREVLGLAHRVLVMRHGRIITELSGERMMNEQAVLPPRLRVEQRRNGLIMNVQVETPEDLDHRQRWNLRLALRA